MKIIDGWACLRFNGGSVLYVNGMQKGGQGSLGLRGIWAGDAAVGGGRRRRPLRFQRQSVIGEVHAGGQGRGDIGVFA